MRALSYSHSCPFALTYVTDNRHCSIAVNVPTQRVNTGSTVLLQQLRAFMFKRLAHVWRCPFVTAVQIALPTIYTLVLMYLIVPRSERMSMASHPLALNLDIFDRTTVVYGGGNSTQTTMLADAYRSQLEGSVHELVHVNDMAKYNSNVGVHSYLVDRGRESSYAYKYGYFVAATFESDGTDEVICTALFNYDAYHTAPISLNLIDNALLRHYVGPGYSIQTTNHFIKFDSTEKVATTDYATNQIFRSAIPATSLGIAFPLIVDLFAIYLIAERSSGSKLLQIVGGMHVMTFWVANVAFDFVVLLFAIAPVYVVFHVYTLTGFTDWHHMMYSVTLLLASGWVNLPMAYLASLMCSTSGRGVSLLIIFTMFTGMHPNDSMCNFKLPIILKQHYTIHK